MPVDLANVKRLFLEIVTRPATPERRAYLDEVCGTDLELRNCLLGLLEAHEQVMTPIPAGSGERPATQEYQPSARLEPGTTIAGKYKIIEPIGSGGMGSVYRAKRVTDLKMEVALKVIKQGMASQQVLARFNMERQALALMNHENIAKVLDAGMLDDGRPFFVMELVKGMPLTAFCDEQKLSISERLELFTGVCLAVQHAHHKGIVHRDLKPSNIIVGLYDNKPIPKVIDFGLAKALHQPLTDDSVHTSLGSFVGTWLYTAPEQAQLNNLDIDTRADIYSLGVILYELLTGVTPIEKARLEKAALNEVVRIIREEDPPKPSTKVNSSASLPSIAAHRRLDPSALTKTIRGELDWIVMKALDKDRNRRYGTASDLAEELQRYLHDEPVRACPPSLRYRAWKVLRKHRGKALVALLLAVVITTGAVVSTIGWITASQERKRADQQAEIAKAVNNFLKDDLLSEADPSVQVKPGQSFVSNITVKAVLDRAAAKVWQRFAEKPLVEAAIRHTIGRTYFGLGDYKNARLHLERAEELRRQFLGKSDPDRLSSLYELGWALFHESQFDRAETFLQEASDLRVQTLGASHQDTCKAKYALGVLWEMQGKHDQAKQALEETLQQQKQLLTIRHRDTLATQRDLAGVLQEKGDFLAAETMLREVLLLQRDVVGADHPDTFTTQNNLAYLYDGMEDYAKAEALLVPLVAVTERTLGPEHPRHLAYLNSLAAIYVKQEKYQEAAALYKKIIPKLKMVSGIAGLDTLAAMSNCGALLVELGQFKEAEPFLLDAYSGCRTTLGESHEKTLLVLENLVKLYGRMKNEKKAREYQKLLDKAKVKPAAPP